MKVLVTGSAGFIGSALSLDKKAEKELLPLQPGGVPDTYADVDGLVEQFGYKPGMSVKLGVENFAVWYKEYNKI